jgi:DNA-binding LacI/PurR family transcriptional regulator
MLGQSLNVQVAITEDHPMSTMRDVAEHAGVSIQTISNVINGRVQMSEATRLRVQRAIEELGYTPNPHARGLRQRSSNTLAFIVVDPAERFLTDEFHDLVLAGICDALRDRNYSLLIQQSLNPYTPLYELPPISAGKVDGAIVTGSSHVLGAGKPPATTVTRRKTGTHVPLVILEQHTTDPSVCSIEAENYNGATALAEHLIGRGRTRFAFVHGMGNWPAVEARLAGLEKTLAKYALSCDHIVTCAWDPEAAYQAVLPLLHAHPQLDAIVAANDVLALGALKAARVAGRKVPDDVAVTGFDDFAFSTCIEPALTTVKVPGYEMGRTAAEMILAHVTSGSFAVQQVRFPTALIVRDSS